MNTTKFPFKLGTDYEDWELDLEILPDSVPHYDSSLYVGKQVHIFMNNPTYKAELIYNFDVLEAVVLTFKMSLSNYNEMMSTLSKKAFKSAIEVNNTVELHQFVLGNFYVASFSIVGVQQLIYSRDYQLYISVLSTLIG